MNLARMLERTATQQPDAVALSGRGVDEPMSYATLADRVEHVAGGLADLGVEPGDRVAILLSNHTAFVETSFALYRLGAIKVPLNTMLTESEHDELVTDAGADLVVTEEQLLDHCRGMDTSFETIITVGGDSDAATDDDDGSIRTYADVRAGSTAPLADVSLSDTAALMYTSGTTGRPKGVNHTHGTWLSVALGLENVLEQDRDGVTLHAAPLTHGSGFLVESTVLAGGTNHIQDGFDPARFLEAVESVGVTTVFLAPTMIYKLLDSYDENSTAQTDALEAIYYAGSPMTAARLEEGIEKLGDVFVQSYGQMECPMLVTALDQADHRRALEESGDCSRLQSAGKEVSIAHARIVDEDGAELPTGEIGEIVVKAPHVTPGYWNLPEANEAAFTDGWLHTGDMARMDDDGYLYIMDRKKDTIISGGMNVYPREIEEVIVEHDAVSNAAVIGVPDDYWGEKVTAIVELRPDVTIDDAAATDEIEALCESTLAAYKKPKQIDIVAELPRNSYGKIRKTELRSAYWDDTDRNVN